MGEKLEIISKAYLSLYGVSSTTVLLSALKELGADCDYYIPNRFKEGYGPNEAAFRTAFDNGFKLIITVDNGIAAIHEAAVAKELGIDLIITDHHEAQTDLPDAFAIIHPKVSPGYQFKELAGVGVAFKLAQYLLGYFPDHLLDLVAIGTVADMVPLVGENRILTYYGLKKLSVTARDGLKAMKKICNIEGNVTEEAIGFQIGPRLNAVGRLQNADLAVQLLCSDERDEAEELADMVQQLNQERQQIVADIVKEAETMVAAHVSDGVIIVAKEGWNEGVLGIVASRLTRKFDRPAIVLSLKPGQAIAKGSARSIPAFNLFQNCMKVRDLFTHFGGHSQAAGMTLPIENIDILRTKLHAFIYEQLTDDDFKQEIIVAKTLTVPEINEALVEEIAALAPFGMANPKPVFHLKEIPAEVRQLGNMKKHLKFQFKKDKSNVEGIGFGMGALYSQIAKSDAVSIVGEIGINEWNGVKKPQMVIQDIKIDEWQLFDHRGRKQVDMTPFISNPEKCLAVSAEKSVLPEEIEHVAYGTEVMDLQQKNTLFLFDLPNDVDELKTLMKQMKPVNIHVCFYSKDSAFMSVFPSREDFVWFYALIRKLKKIDLKTDMDRIRQAKGWPEKRIIFMSKVFFELDFVKIDDSMVVLNSNPSKKDLADSKLYQRRLRQRDIEKELYYSNYHEMKTWFSACMGMEEAPKEELTYGL